MAVQRPAAAALRAVVGVSPKVLGNALVPGVVIACRVVVDPRLVRQAGTPGEKRRGTGPPDSAVASSHLNNGPDLLAHHGWGHRLLE